MMAHVLQTAGGGRVAAFSAVSLLGFCVQLAVFAALTHVRCPYLPATALAVEVAVLHNFAWHCCWTWRDRVAGSDAWVCRLAAFNLTTGVSSLAGNVLGMAILVGVFELPPLAAITASVLCTSVANFTVSNRWVFRPAATLAIVAIGPAAPVATRAEGPGPETIAAWNLHVARTEARLASAASGAWCLRPEHYARVTTPSGTWAGLPTMPTLIDLSPCRHRTISKGTALATLGFQRLVAAGGLEWRRRSILARCRSVQRRVSSFWSSQALAMRRPRAGPPFSSSRLARSARAL
jgi:putative flippase GtrA